MPLVGCVYGEVACRTRGLVGGVMKAGETRNAGLRSELAVGSSVGDDNWRAARS